MNLAERADRGTPRPKRQTRTEHPIEHPRGDDDRGGGVRERADEDLLTTALLAVMNIDRAAVRGVPRIVDLRAKCDMGRMS